MPWRGAQRHNLYERGQDMIYLAQPGSSVGVVRLATSWRRSATSSWDRQATGAASPAFGRRAGAARPTCIASCAPMPLGIGLAPALFTKANSVAN